jgi:hypothetical protein
MPQCYKDKLIMKRIDKNRQKIAKKYMKKSNFNSKVINDIIYNEKSNIVATFKDYLILDDTSEFLKRFYKKTELITRLMKIFTFYSSYSKIFPNYTKIKESKYLYKNIQKKQKMIDNINKGLKPKKEVDSQKQNTNEKLFETKIYNSILNHTNQSNKLGENENEVILTTNMSFENLINGIQNAEKKSTLDLDSSETLRLVYKVNSNADKSPIFMTKEKININDFATNEKKLGTKSSMKEEIIQTQFQGKSTLKIEKTIKLSKLQSLKETLPNNQSSSKSVNNFAKTERQESKTLKELQNDYTSKNQIANIMEQKIINNFNIINNVQNIIQAPPTVLSATASSEMNKDINKYNSNSNSLMNSIHDTFIPSSKNNSNSYKYKYKSSKKSSHDFTNFKQKQTNSRDRAESFNRNQMKKLIHNEVIDSEGLQSERTKIVNVLTKRELKKNYFSVENNKTHIPLIRGKSKELPSRQLILKETNELFKNMAFKNPSFKEVLLNQKQLTKEKCNDTFSPNTKLSNIAKNTFGTTGFKLENPKFFFNNTALKINNLLGVIEKSSVLSERKPKVNF